MNLNTTKPPIQMFKKQWNLYCALILTNVFVMFLVYDCKTVTSIDYYKSVLSIKYYY